MQVSWNQCTAFAVAAQSVLTRTKSGETKLVYAINRVLPRIQKHQTAIKEDISDIEIDHCVTGENDLILRDTHSNLQYTKDGLKARNAAIRKHLSETNVEVEPYFATTLPKDLTIEEIEALAGFVIREDEAMAMIARMDTKDQTDDSQQAIDPAI